MNRTDRLRLDALAATGTAAAQVRAAEHDLENAIARALHWEASWAQIADSLGVTRQSAHRRFRHLNWDPATQTTWSEPPLPL
jgi:hypothetical protein